ncbi:alginate lyase family protein [Candidatus Peregrinibacteria bacterium]|nr:alginate lyase family protein [Candidatus Peregrinibacteria bacterium]
MKTLHRIKRILELPVSAVLIYGARMAARKFSRTFKVSLEKELIPDFSGEKPQLPISLFRAHMTGSKESVDRIVHHEFDLLGSGLTKLGKYIDWQKDFSGRGEIKVPWELSRFQFLSTLMKTPEEAKNLIHDWILKNPLGKGVNWQSPLEVAIRACNFALAWYFLKDTAMWKHNEWQKTFLTSIVEHGKFLLRNLEYGPGFNTNHLIGNFTGLFFLGVLFPEFKEARKWKAKGLIGLEKQIEEQVGSDGILYEASTGYHGFVTEMFGFCTLLARANDIAFSSSFLFKLEKMFAFIRSYTKPNGLAPMLGDSDDGRLFQYHTHLFWLEKELFQKEVGAASISQGFNDSHIYIMRKNDWYLIIHGGGIGQKGNGGHGHNDALSFELTADGEDFIIDPGTYCYTFDPAARQHFRSTAMHNTVTVDGQEQNRFRKDTVFGMIEDAHPQLNRWESTEAFDLFDGQHDGYNRLRNPITHRRKIHFDKKQCVITLTDFFDYCFTDAKRYLLSKDCALRGREDEAHSLRSCVLQWNFHFAPGVAVKLEGRTVILTKNGKRLIMELPQELVKYAKIREDYVSPRYGIKEKAPVLTIHYSMTNAHPFHFTILSA